MNELGPLVETFAGLEPWRGSTVEGSFANFLGVMTDLQFVELYHPPSAQLDKGRVTEIRMPDVKDGEAFFEFAAIYKAVQAAQERFVMVELGGGYAARSVDAHRLLQTMNPMPCQLTIVEAEPTHFQWAKEHLTSNGIDPLDHWLINAAVSTDTDPKLFMQGAGLFYNRLLEGKGIDKLINNLNEINGTEQVLRNLLTAGCCGLEVPYTSDAGKNMFDYKLVSAQPLAEILAPLPHVDLMDMDIQGAEDIVILPAMDIINRRVKRLHIGTHGADIHARLWDLFFEHEWITDFDYAGNTRHDTPWGGFETSDGILHLQNPRL
jgi:hypothetical protein